MGKTQQVSFRCAPCGVTVEVAASRMRPTLCSACNKPMSREPVEVVTLTCPHGCRHSTVKANAARAASSKCVCGATRVLVEGPALRRVAATPAAAPPPSTKPKQKKPKPKKPKQKKPKPARPAPQPEPSAHGHDSGVLVDLVCLSCKGIARGRRGGENCPSPRCRGRMIPASQLPSRYPWEREVSGGGGPGTGKRK